MIVVLHRVHPTLPVIVAANRDEFYARPAAPPELRGHTDQGARVIAGRDLRGGGTWLGATGDGFFVGITNQRTWVPPESRAHSRGAIVGEALEAGTPAAVDRYLDQREPGLTLPFNLLYGDGATLTVAYGRDDGVERLRLEPGVHVLANDRLGSPHMPKTAWAEDRVRSMIDRPWPELRQGLQALLADDHVPAFELPEPPPASPFDAAFLRRLQALCIRTPTYGTVSATILALGEGEMREYLHAEGPPGDVPWDDVTALFR